MSHFDACGQTRPRPDERRTIVPIKNTAQRPQPPMQERGDRSFVRFETSAATPSEMPPLKLPARNTIDPGVVRLGGSNITSVR
jgi:hypothetical protein